MRWKFWKPEPPSLVELQQIIRKHSRYWNDEEVDAFDLLDKSIERFEILAGIVKERQEQDLPKDLKPCVMTRQQILKKYGYPIPPNQRGFILHVKICISFEDGSFVQFVKDLEKKTGKKCLHTVAMLNPQEFVWTFEVTNQEAKQW